MKNIIRLFFVLTCIVSQPLFAAKYTWTGATSTNWTVNTNWSPNGIPSTTDTVKIVSTTNSPVLQASSYEVDFDASWFDLCGDPGNEATQTISVVAQSPPAATLTIAQSINSNCTVDLTATYSSPGSETYLWSNGITTIQNLNLPIDGGFYQVTVTDGSCSYIANIFLEENPNIALDATYITNCDGDPVTLTPQTNCSSCTFLWSNSTSSPNLTAASGKFTVTITNATNGCTATATTEVIDISSINATLALSNDGILCTGNPNLEPTITANVPIFGSPFSYLWFLPNSTSSPTTNSVLATHAGNYTVQIANSYGCTISLTTNPIDITPQVSFSPSVLSVPSSTTSTTLTGLVSNTISPTYLWSSGTSSTSTNTVALNSSSNIFTLTVTNSYLGYNCAQSANVQVDIAGNLRCVPLGPELDQRDFDDPNLGVNIPSGAYDLKSNIFIDGTVHLGPGIEIQIDPGISITVRGGATFNIEEGCNIYSCGDDMWDGIIVEPGVTLRIRGTSTNQALIEDAKIAVNASGSANISAIDNTIFNSNYISVYLSNGDFSDANFAGAKFTCTKFLDKPYNNSVNDRYTSSHIKAINAGTINLGIGLSDGNEFYDAMYILDFDRTNLNVDDCYFKQSSVPNVFKNMAAIRFFGEVSDQSKSYYLNVGFNSSTKTKNKFDECKRGIYTKFRTNVTIERNEFYRGLEGILIAYNDRSNVPNRSGTVSLTDNDFDYVSGTSISMFQNPKVYSYIHNNRINIFNGFIFDPILESRKGILISGANLNPIGSNNGVTYVVSNNQIRNCRFGIQLMDQEYGTVVENDVIFDIPDVYLDYALNVSRSGISLQNTRSVAVTNNYIRRIQTTLNGSMIDPTKTLLCGINVDFSGSNFKQNNTANIPTHYKISNTCDLSTFECNELDNGLEGFKLEGGTISSQGLIDQPNGNKWINWPLASTGYTRINGNGQPGLRDWFFDQNNPALEDPTDGGTMGLPGGIVQAGIPFPSCTVNPCPYCDVERLYIILSNADSLNYSDEQKFALEKFVYRNLKDSLQLMNSGSTFDAALQNFFTSVSLQNVGLLNSIDELLNNNQYATAYLNSLSIESDRLVEQNLATVNRICAQYEMDFDNLDESSYQELLAIAYQYPRFGGEAVFRARAILGIDVDDTELALRQSNSEHTNADEEKNKKLTLIPNPTKGLFTANYLLEENESATLQLTDQFSRLMFTKVISYPNSLCNFDLSTNKSGVYYLNLTTSKGEIVNEKIVLIK